VDLSIGSFHWIYLLVILVKATQPLKPIMWASMDLSTGSFHWIFPLDLPPALLYSGSEVLALVEVRKINRCGQRINQN
jgi:hypothetical protein